MTVPVEVKATENSNDPRTLILCLVTDKKYRKMGGSEGLASAIKRSGREALIKQIQVEDIMNDTRNDTDTGTGNGKSFDFTSNILTEISKEYTSITLIHKYSDYFKYLDAKRVLQLRNWLSNDSKGVCRVLDAPEKIDVLSSRLQTGLLIREMCQGEGGFESRGLQWPEFQMNWTGDLGYPVIIKPIDACATDESHWMTLISSQTANDVLYSDCLVQKFYEHFGILYKVYVIGNVIEIVARPSISSKTCSTPVFRFNTHKFKASEGDLSAEKLEEAAERLAPFRELIENFARELKVRLNLTWFGIDVILPEDAKDGIRAAVIDVNYMPGYDGIKDLPDKLIKAILDY